MRKLKVGAVIRGVGGVVSNVGLVSRATGFWFAALVVIALIGGVLSKSYGLRQTQLSEIFPQAAPADLALI